ncbi:expression regulator [Minicystis rosea]|nr:expression regulator [Minicystis rosea]
MFGTLKPHTCRMGCDRARAYETFYCGLCKSLGDHFGTLTRALLNYDAVFLALVADGLMETAAEPDRCRCPILPVTFRPTVRPDSPAMRYAAAMQMLLSDQWLADRAEDGKPAAVAARPLLSGKVEAARGILADLGISLADLDGFEHEQARREVPGVTGPRAAAEPTASALARVFERMAGLPGVSPAARSEEGRAALAAFGRHLGSAIYLIDALDDLEKDHRGGAFNPCLARGPRDRAPRVSWPRVEVAWGLLHDDLAALDDLAGALPLLRHRDLVRSVVAVEMRRLARAAAQKAHAYARAEDAAARARPRPLPLRVLAAVATAFVFVWVWLSSLPAFARGPASRRLPPAGAHDAGAHDAGAHDAGADAGRGGLVPPAWEPRLPPPSGPVPTSEPGPSKPKPPSSATPSGAGASPTEPGTAPAPTTPPSKPGGGTGSGGCGNPCSGCNPSSSSCDCCDSCKDCGGSCKDCGGCCKTCDGCNGCCNSCNGGCNGCCK